MCGAGDDSPLEAFRNRCLQTIMETTSFFFNSSQYTFLQPAGKLGQGEGLGGAPKWVIISHFLTAWWASRNAVFARKNTVFSSPHPPPSDSIVTLFECEISWASTWIVIMEDVCLMSLPWSCRHTEDPTTSIKVKKKKKLASCCPKYERGKVLFLLGSINPLESPSPGCLEKKMEFPDLKATFSAKIHGANRQMVNGAGF